MSETSWIIPKNEGDNEKISQEQKKMYGDLIVRTNQGGSSNQNASQGNNNQLHNRYRVTKFSNR